MTTLRRPLQVFIFHTQSDWETAHALTEQLALKGVKVILPEDVEPVITNGKLDKEQNMYERAVQAADAALFCLSARFHELDALKYLAWRPVLAAALRKSQGELYVMTVRLQPCEIPAGLHRWQPVNLYKRRGYEELMHALKLRAEKCGAALTPLEDWSNNPFVIEPEAEEEEEDFEAKVAVRRSSLPMWGLIGLALLALAVVLFQSNRNGNSIPASQTIDPVDALAQRATQNVIASGTARAGTVTADMANAEENRIQTQVFLTSAPITKTAEAAQALITPTITLMPVIRRLTWIGMAPKLTAPGAARACPPKPNGRKRRADPLRSSIPGAMRPTASSPTITGASATPWSWTSTPSAAASMGFTTYREMPQSGRAACGCRIHTTRRMDAKIPPPLRPASCAADLGHRRPRKSLPITASVLIH